MRVIGAVLNNLKPGQGSSLPFVLVHLACFLAFFIGFSWSAVAVCAMTFWLRMFAVLRRSNIP